MSNESKAVFLSYASQDADAAKRICDALRQAGVEVWFDQSELVGGDQWDGKIRGQIGSCALFVPIISANTQARLEGYFRIEWKLAARRTHAMASAKAFLLPIVIDDTRDASAHVPDEFRDVQWTKLPGGETPAAFCERVKKLLGGEPEDRGQTSHGLGRATGPGSAADDIGKAEDRARNQEPKTQTLRLGRWWWVLPIFGVAMALVLVLKESRPVAPVQPVSAQAAPKTSEARKLTGQAQALIDDPNFTRENYQLADELCQRALALDAADTEIWAIAALVSTDLISLNYDTSPQRRELGRTQADRALRLDPRSIHAGLAMAKNQRLVGDLPEAIRRLRELLKRAPTDRLVLRELARTERANGNDAGVNEALALLQALPGGDSLAPAIEVKDLRNLGRVGEAETLVDQLLAGSPVRPAYYEKLLLLARSWSDLEAARLFLKNIPTEYMREDAFGSMAAQIWIWSGDGDRALKVLDKMPHDYLEEFGADEPKSYLAGWAHQIVGRSTAAQAEWQNALALVETRLSANKSGLDLLFMKATLQALLGQKDAARATWKLRIELGGETQSVAPLFEARFRILLGEPEEAITLLERQWSQQALGERNWYFSLLRYAPDFAPIRHDPRVQGIITSEMAEIRARRRGQSGAQGAVGSGAPQADAKSVAVLAFANLSDDKANEYFSDGISEELLNVLAKIPGLKVSARTSAFYFKGKEVPIPEIAKQLGVAYVVEGSVRKAGDKVRITAQLIKAADGFNVWSDTFTRDLKDIFAVQDEIAGLIAKNLELKMGINQVGARQAVSPEAYQEYLVGRAAAAKAGMADLREAVTHFERAVALEPKFTAAWVQLASAHTRLGRWGGAPTLQAWQAARAAIDRAKALEPDSPDVLLALGWILRTADWDWRGAEQAFRRTLQLQPNQPEALAGAAVLLFNIGQTEEAYRLGQQAVQLDPLNAAAYIDLSIMFYLNKNWAEAERSARRALQLAPGGASYHSILAWSLIAQQRYAEAEAEVALESDVIEQTTVYGLLAVARGQGQAARDRLARLEEFARINGDSADLQQSIAWLCAGLGEKDRAFAALERAVASRDPSMSWLLNSWYLQPLFSDPRWPVLVRKVGLADDQLK